MTRIPFLLLLSLLFVGGAMGADRPNILVILSDDQGFQDLGCQGSPDLKTPHIDRLAAGGVRFTDAHVSASVCSPSRAGMMTGRYQQRFGHESNSPPKGKGMDVKEKTIADYLAGLGYRTGLIGKWHLGNTEAFYPNRRGFEAFYGLREGSRSYWYDTKKSDKPGGAHAIERNGTQEAFDGYLTDVFGAEAVRFVGAKDPRPWFLFLSFTAPHSPMHATEEDLERFAHIESKKRRTYAAMVWAMDRAIGAVVDQLKTDGALDNTLIWFLSDNGGASGNAPVCLPCRNGKRFTPSTRADSSTLPPAAATAVGRISSELLNP